MNVNSANLQHTVPSYYGYYPPPMIKMVRMENSGARTVPYEETSKEEEENPKKNYRTKKRAHFTSVDPKKFINPHKFYRFYSDFIIFEENQSFQVRPELYNYFKILTKASACSKTNRIIFSVEENSNVFSPPLDYTVSRWMSFGTVEAMEWALTVKQHGESYRANHLKLRAFGSSITKEVQEENQKILNSIFKDYACIGHRLFLNDDACTIGEMFITEKYLELIGFPKEKYISYCLRLGYLNWLYEQKQVQRAQFSFLMNSLFQINGFRKESPEAPSIIVNFKKKMAVPVYLKSYTFLGKEGDRVYFDSFVAYRPNNLAPSFELPTYHEIDDPISKAEAIADKKNLFSFLKTYYGGEYPEQEDLYEKNRCRIKLLPQNPVVQQEVHQEQLTVNSSKPAAEESNNSDTSFPESQDNTT